MSNVPMSTVVGQTPHPGFSAWGYHKGQDELYERVRHESHSRHAIRYPADPEVTLFRPDRGGDSGAWDRGHQCRLQPAV